MSTKHSAEEVASHILETDSTDDTDFVMDLLKDVRQFSKWALGLVKLSAIDNWCSDKETAEYYATQDLREFPPIVLIPLASGPRSKKWAIVDGAHRTWAHEIAGRKTIMAFHPV